MAIVKEIQNPIKSSEAVSKAIAYISRENKIFSLNYENCSGDTKDIAKQFYITRKAFNQNKGILAHHYVQSFSPDDNVSPETAHKIGCELIKKVAPNYQVLLSTHIDKGHIHNHFIINSCNIETGYKWHGNKATLNNVRNESDILCKKNSLSVIDKESKYKALDQTTYQLAKKGKSWKVNLVRDLDEVLLSCKGKLQFIDTLNKKGYSVKYTNANITIQKNGEKKGIRVDTLAKQFGTKYTKENIEKSLGIINQQEKENIKSVPPKLKRQKELSSEWERFEKFYFSGNNRILKNAEKLWRENQRPLYSGNISYSKLKQVQGENFSMRISVDKIEKIINKPMFYAVKNFDDGTALITVKEKDKERLCKFINVNMDEADNQAEEIKNKMIYSEMKKQNEKIEYLVVSKDELLLLKKEYVPIAYFSKNEKFNVAFLQKNKERVMRVISSENKKLNAENENLRVYHKLKSISAATGERLQYRMVTEREVNELQKTGLSFAVFQKAEKFNIAYLESEMKKIKSKEEIEKQEYKNQGVVK